MKWLLGLGIVAVLLISGCTAFFGTDHEKEAEDSWREFTSCVNDGRFRWDNEEQKCYPRESTHGCIELDRYFSHAR